VKLLLDTCTFLWIAAGSPQLSKQAAQLFADPANDVFLSVVSSWEIAVKHSLGRLPLPAPPINFVPAQREAHGIALLPLSEEEALYVSRIPSLHRDPFDRMLVCQAVVNGFAVLTPDSLISQYAVRTFW
jgi:PIN domain nuclease of toxin-antitoxin system